MQLKKNLLASLLCLSLVACSDNTPTGEKQAEEVEARYRDYITKSNQQLSIAKPLNFKEIRYQIDNYQKGTESSVSEDQFVFKDLQNEVFIINVHNDIKHDTNLAKQGIVGEVNSTLSIAPETQTAYEIEDIFEYINPYLTLKTRFKTNDEVQTIIALSPIQKDSFGYEGFNYQTDFNQKDYASYLYPQKISFKSGKLSLISDEIFLNLHPFEFNGDFNGKNGEFTSTPIKLQAIENNTIFEFDINKVVFKLKDLKLDSNNLVLGEQELKLQKLNIKNDESIYEFPEFVVLQRQTQKNNKYNFSNHLRLDIKTDLLKEIFGIDNFHINKLQLDVKLLNISKESYAQLEKIFSFEGNKDVLLNTFINEIINILANGANIESKLVITTSQGEIIGDYNLKLQKGKNINEHEKEILINALLRNNGEALLNLLLSKLEININLSTPISTIHALGLDIFLTLYGDEYVKIKDDKAIININIKDNKLHYKNGSIDLRPILRRL